MADNSFLRFVNSFQEALLNENFPSVDVIEDRIIVQKPDETFLQTTNCSRDIAFAGNLLAELVDYREQTVFTFTIGVNFFYEEFVNTVTGIKQISYEFGYIGIDFHKKRLFLKLSQPGISNNVWYSAPFCVTHYESEKTLLFRYKHPYYFRGISYDVKDYFQSIRLYVYESDMDFKIENQGYTELSGDEVNYRQIITKKLKSKFIKCNNFILERVASMFGHDILYINLFRCNNKPTLKKGDKKGNSNFFDLETEYNLSEQTLPIQHQIYQDLGVIARVPDGPYSLSDYNSATSTSTQFSLGFNKPFTIASDIEARLYKAGVLIATFDASKFSIVGQTLNIDVSSYPVSAIDDYCIVIDPDKVQGANESWQGFAFDEWKFSITQGFYNSIYYNTSNYNTD